MPTVRVHKPIVILVLEWMITAALGSFDYDNVYGEYRVTRESHTLNQPPKTSLRCGELDPNKISANQMAPERKGFADSSKGG